MLIEFLKPQGSFRVGDQTQNLPDETVSMLVTERDAKLILTKWMQRFEAEVVNPFEGEVLHLYLDTCGLPTLGKGCQVSLMECMTVLFLKDGRPATSDEIGQEYRRVKALPFGWQYTAAHFDSSKSLRITHDESEMLLGRRFASLVKLMHSLFPAFESWPDEVKMAAVEIPWSIGEAKFAHGWPLFREALQRRDWKAAAAECAVNDASGVYAARNAHRKQLLLSAA